MSETISPDVVRDLLPKRSSMELVQSTTENINNLIQGTDPEFRTNFRDNLLGFNSVMQTGKYKVSDYVNAVKFVCHRMGGNSFADAYQKTFPERYDKLIAEGKSPKAISSYVSAYSNNKLVTLLLEQAAVPVHLLNADIFQEAINESAKLMRDAKSELVRQKAADSLMNHLKPPETAKVSLDVTIGQSDVLDELRDVSRELARAQVQAVQDKRQSVLAVAHSKLNTVEYD